jgi:hypothetical protein
MMVRKQAKGFFMGNETKVNVPKDKPIFKNKSDAGKGDKPRNISRDYWNNFDEIKGFKKSKYK